MKDFYCVEIEFPGVDLDVFFPNKEPVENVHHAHLFLAQDKIELKFFYKPETLFSYKLTDWLYKNNWRIFGSNIKANIEEGEYVGINLSESKPVSYYHRVSDLEGGFSLLFLKIDSVRLYSKPNKEKENTARFNMTDPGFWAVEPYYISSLNANILSFKKLDGLDVFHQIENAWFSFEFLTRYKDGSNERKVEIRKIPTIRFEYPKSTTEEKAVGYGEIVMHLASFFFHLPIDYSSSVIYLPEKTVHIKKSLQKCLQDKKMSLTLFGFFSFHKLLLASWQEEFLQNKTKLFKVTELFNQALIVDDYSRFLIQYAIIEICSYSERDEKEFNFTVNSKQKKKKFAEACELILEILPRKEQKAFKQKWESNQGKFYLMPMKSHLETFFESQGFDISRFPITVSQLKSFRDDIIHGSLNKIDFAELQNINRLLYNLNGAMILNLMGLDDWKEQFEFAKQSN